MKVLLATAADEVDRSGPSHSSRLYNDVFVRSLKLLDVST